MIDTESSLMSLLTGKDGSEEMAVNFLNPMQKNRKPRLPLIFPVEHNRRGTYSDVFYEK